MTIWIIFVPLIIWIIMGCLTVAMFVHNVRKDTHLQQAPIFSSWVKVFVFWPFPLFCWFVIRSVENMNKYREEKNG